MNSIEKKYSIILIIANANFQLYGSSPEARPTCPPTIALESIRWGLIMLWQRSAGPVE